MPAEKKLMTEFMKNMLTSINQNVTKSDITVLHSLAEIKKMEPKKIICLKHLYVLHSYIALKSSYALNTYVMLRF